MTRYFMLLAVMWIILKEIKILKEKNAAVVKEIFGIPLWLSVVFSIVLLAFMCSSADGLESLPDLFLIFYLPFYLYRREICLKKIEPDPNAPRDPLFFLLDLFGLILWFVFGSMIINLIVEPLTYALPEFHSKLGELMLGLALSYIFMLGLLYRAVKRMSPDGFWKSLGFQVEKRSLKKVIFLSAGMGLFFAWISTYIITVRDVHPETPMQQILDSPTPALPLALFVLFAIGAAPLIEEMIFRGYFFAVLLRNMSPGAAIVLISLAFALFHVGQYWGDWMAIAMVTVLGFALTILRAVSGTTLSSTIMHYVYNGSVTLFFVVMQLLSNPVYMKYRMEYQKLDYPARESLLQESIEKNPKLAEAYNDLAWTYAGQNKKLEEALTLADQALRLEPDRDVYVDTKAEVLFKLGRLKESERLCKKILHETRSDDLRKIQDERLEKIHQKGIK